VCGQGLADWGRVAQCRHFSVKRRGGYSDADIHTKGEAKGAEAPAPFS